MRPHTLVMLVVDCGQIVLYRSTERAYLASSEHSLEFILIKFTTLLPLVGVIRVSVCVCTRASFNWKIKYANDIALFSCKDRSKSHIELLRILRAHENCVTIKWRNRDPLRLSCKLNCMAILRLHLNRTYWISSGVQRVYLHFQRIGVSATIHLNCLSQ